MRNGFGGRAGRPVLVAMYVRLARREEQEVRARFGEAYERYAAEVPAFLPRWRTNSAAGGGTGRSALP